MKIVSFLLLQKKQQEKFEIVVTNLHGNKLFKGDCLFEYEERFHESILTAYFSLGGHFKDVLDMTSKFSLYNIEMFRRHGTKTGIVLQPTDFASEQGYVEEYYPSIEEGKSAWKSCNQSLFYYFEVK